MSLSRQNLIDTIDRELPQTQCEQCGYNGCYAYASALVNNETKINRCPPGGDSVLQKLAEITNRQIIPLDLSCGVHKSSQAVYIDEALCIGCTKCIQACPVDAIVGTKKMMHTVIQDECTGCELCIAPCPLDCIIIKFLEIDANANVYDNADQVGLTLFEKKRATKSRQRFNARQDRLNRRGTITDTLLPKENIQLADRTDPIDMLNLIQQAKNQFKLK